MYSVVLMVAMTGGADVQAGLFNHKSSGCCGYSSCCGVVVSSGCCGYSSCCGTSYGCCGSSYGCCGTVSYGCCGSSYGCCGSSCHGSKHSSKHHGCCGGSGGFFGRMFGGKHSHGCCGSSCCGTSYGCCGTVSYGCCGSSYGCCGTTGYGCCGGSAVIPSTPVAPIVGDKVIEGTVVPPATGEKIIEQPIEGKKIEKKDGKKIEPKPGEEGLGAADAPATIIVNLPADAKLTVDGVATTSVAARRVFQSPALEAGKLFRYNLQAEISHEGKSVVVNKEVRIEAGATVEVSLTAADLAVASR